MSLAIYNKKRDFKHTPEPTGIKKASHSLRFVVQRHEASHLHFDFRLELDGVLKSWAIPKGPSLNPSSKRLAVQVEDHPAGYINFEGTIPSGNYGAGTVEIWDKGKFQPVDKLHKPVTEKQAVKDLKKGELKFLLGGKKLKGEFVLVRLKDDKNWLLIKHKDSYAVDRIYNAEEQTNGTSPAKAPAVTTNISPKTGKQNKTVKIGKHTVQLTNLDKLFWPDEGFTKGDLINYYDTMASYILPHLKDRPLSLKRNPNGIRDEGFYHKDAGEHAPSFVDVFTVKSESNNKMIDYIVCNNKPTLLYLANLGCIEMNPWNSTTRMPAYPTWMVIDIDPSSKNKFTDVIDVALVTKSVLDKAGVPSYCKTSGSTGLHVYVPLKNKYDYVTVKKFAHIVASLVQEQLPDTTSLERSLSKRGSRIYIDYLQNSTGQTLASVYSLRPVASACVSTPLDWKELTYRLHPSDFTLQNILKRVKKKGDIFLPVLDESVSLPKALKALTA